MILDEHERRIAIFDSRNGLVEDPKAEHDAEKFIRPWTEDEIRVYHEKFTAYGRTFDASRSTCPVAILRIAWFITIEIKRRRMGSNRRKAAKKRKMYNEGREAVRLGYTAP